MRLGPVWGPSPLPVSLRVLVEFSALCLWTEVPVFLLQATDWWLISAPRTLLPFPTMWLSPFGLSSLNLWILHLWPLVSWWFNWLEQPHLTQEQGIISGGNLEAISVFCLPPARIINQLSKTKQLQSPSVETPQTTKDKKIIFTHPESKQKYLCLIKKSCEKNKYFSFLKIQNRYFPLLLVSQEMSTWKC